MIGARTLRRLARRLGVTAFEPGLPASLPGLRLPTGKVLVRLDAGDTPATLRRRARAFQRDLRAHGLPTRAPRARGGARR